ncbi:hypothetical protein FA13DRAFT_1722803 [Coprinellus micaceus]|uniref:Uncharacterized protein n=1 Tax=Coprinellus micaceus TaxID=71717 RepID=A0A4Y7RIA8_COPMI|nr:hypothetical protein FA13DRAFT_1722803 [Coprinellus micaceus]
MPLSLPSPSYFIGYKEQKAKRPRRIGAQPESDSDSDSDSEAPTARLVFHLQDRNSESNAMGPDRHDHASDSEAAAAAATAAHFGNDFAHSLAGPAAIHARHDPAQTPINTLQLAPSVASSESTFLFVKDRPVPSSLPATPSSFFDTHSFELNNASPASSSSYPYSLTDFGIQHLEDTPIHSADRSRSPTPVLWTMLLMATCGACPSLPGIAKENPPTSTPDNTSFGTPAKSSPLSSTASVPEEGIRKMVHLDEDSIGVTARAPQAC